jgi:hypothetical protein
MCVAVVDAYTMVDLDLGLLASALEAERRGSASVAGYIVHQSVAVLQLVGVVPYCFRPLGAAQVTSAAAPI